MIVCVCGLTMTMECSTENCLISKSVLLSKGVEMLHNALMEVIINIPEECLVMNIIKRTADGKVLKL